MTPAKQADTTNRFIQFLAPPDLTNVFWARNSTMFAFGVGANPLLLFTLFMVDRHFLCKAASLS